MPSKSRPRPARFSKGYAAALGTVLIWSTPSLFMFYLNDFYDPYAQNFYRYSLACLAVLPFAFYFRERDRTRLDRRLFFACLYPALPNVVHQITQVISLHFMGPAVFAIFMRATVIITAIFALIFFPEERWIVRQRNFQLGTLLGLAGAIGVIWFQPGGDVARISWQGLSIAFCAATSWALYGVLVKRPSAELGTVRSFGIISFITSVLLLPLTLAFGKIATPLHAGLQANSILIISAVTCISLAHVLYYISIRELGVALSQTLQLLCPLIALALSGWFFGERLSAPQIASALVLLFGAFLAMRLKPRATATAAEAL